MSIEPIQRLTLSDQVAAGLTRLIHEQGLQAGASLPSEAKLAEQFGVSRPVVREALRSLVGRGLLEVANGRGAIVRPLDGEPLRAFFERAVSADAGAITELMELRRGIEVHAARLAAQAHDAEQLRRMSEIAAEMRASLSDPARYVQLDLEFHIALARATGNALVGHLMESVRNILQSSIDEGFRARTDAEEIERAHRRHETLVQELQRGDADAAARTMEAHFDDALSALAGRASQVQ